MNPAADLIALQDKATRIAKQIREIQVFKLKYAIEGLTRIAKGTWDDGSAIDTDYINRNGPRYLKDKAEAEAAIAELTVKLGQVEAQRPVVSSLPFNEVLRFFQGKGYEGARAGLELLQVSMEEGGFVPGASRRVQATLNQAKAAKKLVAKDPQGFKAAMAPILAIIEKYTVSATRPAVFTMMNASPLISGNLKELGAEKVEVCPMKFEQIEYINEKGRKAIKTVAILLWPEGTKHGTSKYKGTNNNHQCEACGHAIKNGFNWVPLILWDKAGTPKSLWVGRDCAETLFGVRMDGSLEIQGE